MTFIHFIEKKLQFIKECTECQYTMEEYKEHKTAHRRWGDKASYLKNVKCSGEPRNMAALTL